MPRRISTLLTFPYKFISPIFLVFWLFVVMEARDLVFLVFGVLIFGFNVWLSWGLKKISIDDNNLYVSNYRREITIPITEIDDVREFILSEPRRVTIHLKNPTEFGQKIIFLATYRWFAFLSPHPIVDELTQLAYRKIMAEP